MKSALKRLLDAFEAIGEMHGEVYDTVVREVTHGAVYTHAIVAQPDAEMPDSFGMFSDEGNVAVREALTAFVADPDVIAFREASTPQQRLDAFQDATVLSSEGMTYDEYFGHLDTLP